MAIIINGSGSITGVSVGGLPDGIVDTDMLATNSVSSEKLQSGAVTITSGDLPAGSILQMAMVETKTASTPANSESTILTNTITTKASSTDSKIFVIATLAHGLGPRSTNLDPYGLIAKIKEDGSAMTEFRADVFAGSGTGDAYGPEYDIRTTSMSAISGATWSAGDSISYTVTARADGNGNVFINRSYQNSDSNAISYLLVMEVAK